MHNFCDICLIYKLVKRFDRFQETIDLCETFPSNIAYLICMNSCEACRIYRNLENSTKVNQLTFLTDKQDT
jgi:hypothetical protein